MIILDRLLEVKNLENDMVLPGIEPGFYPSQGYVLTIGLQDRGNI
jgi:hypothetical protein